MPNRVAANLRRVVTGRPLKEYKVHEPWSVIPVRAPLGSRHARGGFGLMAFFCGHSLRRASDFVAFIASTQPNFYRSRAPMGAAIWPRGIDLRSICRHSNLPVIDD